MAAGRDCMETPMRPDKDSKCVWAQALLAVAGWALSGFAVFAGAQPAPSAPAVTAVPASSAMSHAGHAPPGCTTTALACASAAMPFMDARGILWVVWSAGGSVSVARSADAGLSFGPAVEVGRHGAYLDLGADAKPQIVVDANGRAIVAYGVFKDKNWNAQVLVSTSSDGGATFSPPRSLSSDPASQRFPALAISADGTVIATWLDKRTTDAASKRGLKQDGAAIAYARSTDGGASFHAEAIAQDRTCECCRLGMAFDAQQRPVVLFRSIFDDRERDHAVLTFSAKGDAGPAYRVAADHWAIEGCPHHGPSLAVSSDGAYLAAWFTLGQAREGLFFARSGDGGRTFSSPVAVGDADRQAGRPFLLARGQSVWLVWKEFDGKRIFVMVRKSQDGGRSWSNDRQAAETAGYADHPVLVSDRQHVYLSWMTRGEGYRLMKLDTL
jgi:hypothetical protein